VDLSRLQFSAGLADIVRLVKANADPELIKTFIEHSGISYNPSAQEVIALKKLGVSDEIIITLIGHRSRVLETAHPSPPQIVKVPRAEEIPVPPRLPDVGGYRVHPHPAPVFVGFGSLSSFNNSYATFVNGHPVYAGYYLPSYPVVW
jgi:hypothetical protein